MFLVVNSRPPHQSERRSCARYEKMEYSTAQFSAHTYIIHT